MRGSVHFARDTVTAAAQHVELHIFEDGAGGENYFTCAADDVALAVKRVGD